MRDALIVIDMQQAAFGPTAVPKHDAVGTIARIRHLAGTVRTNGGAVIFVQHDGPPGDPFHPGQPGWRLLPDLGVLTTDTIVRKKACDAFLDTPLHDTLRAKSIDRLIVTGWATDYCVDTTVRAALSRSLPTVVPSDGHTCADRPHLPAVKIIEHHNAVWADFIAPNGPALVQPCATLRLST